MIIFHYLLIDISLLYQFSPSILCITFILSFVQSFSAETSSDQMGKKSKKPSTAAASVVTEQHAADPGPSKKGLISDTTCLGLGNTTWQSIYNLVEAEEPQQTTVEASADASQKSDATLKDLADSYLHKIAAREKILPYLSLIHI